MLNRYILAVTLAAIIAVLGGCGPANWKSIYRTTNLDDGNSIITGAKQRVITNTEGSVFQGKNEPKRIVCAEPSPDVAQAISESLTLAIKADVEGQGGAGAFGRTIVETVAQLGERLATIQLLRDGLYRACEAFANGALSDTGYAVLLSRYDDTMVTMLTAELAAGAFGRSLATLGGQGSTESSAAGTMESLVETAKESAVESQGVANAKKAELAEAETVLKEADAALAKAEQDNPGVDHAKEEFAVTEATKEKENAKAELKTADKLATKTNAVATAVAAGAITRTQNPLIAKTLAEMQRKYIENINSDALIVACIIEMSRSPHSNTSALTRLCLGDGDKPGIVAQIIEINGRLLESKINRNNLHHSVKNIETAVKELAPFVSK